MLLGQQDSTSSLTKEEKTHVDSQSVSGSGVYDYTAVTESEEDEGFDFGSSQNPQSDLAQASVDGFDFDSSSHIEQDFSQVSMYGHDEEEFDFGENDFLFETGPDSELEKWEASSSNEEDHDFSTGPD